MNVRSRKKSEVLKSEREELSAKEIASLKRAQKDVKAGRVTRFTCGEVR